jgi:nitrate reductase gamma subunit
MKRILISKPQNKQSVVLFKQQKKTVVMWAFAFVSMLFGFNYSAQASQGEELFNKYCMTCHSLTDKSMVGPGLGGVVEKRTPEWLVSWIKDPMAMVNGGDEQAVEVYNTYNQIPMPGFPQFADAEMTALIDFLAEQKLPEAAASSGGTSAVATTSGAAKSSSPSASGDGWGTDIVFWSLIILILIGYFVVQYRRKMKSLMSSHGYFKEPHYTPNYQGKFFLYLVLAAVIIFYVVKGLEINAGAINIISFIVIPYLTVGVFLVGSIYRYKKRGYQVSSLSSQFLEGKKLFWGSQPFHWGLLVLFLGHLSAFLFPSAILAWNGQPLRLLILEVTGFAFGLSALIGLFLLIRRRLTNKTLLVVSNNMDMVVYTILLVQILSGLGVALFVRWGSSWFSSVLTPYLRSLFSFNPDVAAVVELPWLIQVHIISAFVIIGVIPFTRFMHFLVAPIDYIWRKYQVVVWNWNPKSIRKSRRHTFGKTPRNH